MKRIRNIFAKSAVFFFAVVFANNAFATEGDQKTEKFWLIPYEPNSIVYQHTAKDENSWEANFSFRYYFTEPPLPSDQKRLGLYFSYTGKFDFYADTRPSGPVVNRLNNPALHYRFDDMGWFATVCKNCQWLDMAFEHISNGQALDASKNQALLRNAYNAGNHALMDTISRTSATIALTAETKFKVSEANELYVKAFARRGQEADVFWGEYDGKGVDFNDFQLVRSIWRINLERLFPFTFPEVSKRQKREFHAEWNVGRKGLSTDSWNIMLNLPFVAPPWVPVVGGLAIPFAMTAHYGPMNNLSNYTESQRSLGIGLAFSH